ncbi:MAG: hypothetical protein VX217_04545, partial [Acidobacteriota bacterium]|nr:hypothetical protein [Acidobacteriota bacterium]
VVKPSVVAELESSTQVLGQRVEKCDKASNVLSEVGWQLEKNGAETVAEHKGGFEEDIKRLMDVFEPTKMGDAPRGFDGETEFFGNLCGPVFHDFSVRQAVEGVVDLYRRKVLPIEGKQVPVGQLFGIEGSLPFLVAKAACTDA